jgi:hypothetical protein
VRGKIQLREAQGDGKGSEVLGGISDTGAWYRIGAPVNDVTVLPHEKLYMEHLPDTDRYYKSFMHRDTIDFICVTK